MNSDKKIRYQFLGSFEVPEDNVKINFQHQGTTIDEFHDLVGKLISVEHAQYHHGSVLSESEPTSEEFEQGMEAYNSGYSKFYNPYRNYGPEASTKLSDWDDGWHFAERHKSMIEGKIDFIKMRNTLFQAIEYLRGIEDGKDGNCNIDNSGFCQTHMAYRDPDTGLCFFKNISNFVEQFDNENIKRQD